MLPVQGVKAERTSYKTRVQTYTMFRTVAAMHESRVTAPSEFHLPRANLHVTNAAKAEVTIVYDASRDKETYNWNLMLHVVW
jgi:hypothetical protein